MHHPLAVIVGIAVGFILDIGHKVKDIAVPVDCDFPARIIHNGAGAVVVILDHAKGGHMFQCRAAQCLFNGAHLPEIGRAHV